MSLALSGVDETNVLMLYAKMTGKLAVSATIHSAATTSDTWRMLL